MYVEIPDLRRMLENFLTIRALESRPRDDERRILQETADLELSIAPIARACFAISANVRR